MIKKYKDNGEDVEVIYHYSHLALSEIIKFLEQYKKKWKYKDTCFYFEGENKNMQHLPLNRNLVKNSKGEFYIRDCFYFTNNHFPD